MLWLVLNENRCWVYGEAKIFADSIPNTFFSKNTSDRSFICSFDKEQSILLLFIQKLGEGEVRRFIRMIHTYSLALLAFEVRIDKAVKRQADAIFKLPYLKYASVVLAIELSSMLRESARHLVAVYSTSTSIYRCSRLDRAETDRDE